MVTANWRPSASKDVLIKRAHMLKRIRAFFDALDILEVETPILASSTNTDPNIESLTTQFREQLFYLNTSPEFSMKRLLAAYKEPVFQVCKAFRDDELGVNHNPEFTMLEWYRPGFSMFELMDEIESLLKNLFGSDDLSFDRISYRDAFRKYSGLDPHLATSQECMECADEHGIEQPVGMRDVKDEWLDWLLTQLVLPALGKNKFTFIYHYPESQAALARVDRDEMGINVASRFELLYGEVELANGFHELLDSDEQRQRFESQNSKRHEQKKQPVQVDEYLLAALEHGLPDCSGVAMGLDRLLMIACELQSIEQSLAFPWSRI